MNTFPEYERHPFNVFPVMSDPEIDELAKDIKANGLTHPIVIFARKILDGWNRYLACKKAGVMPDFFEYPGDTPIQFSLSLNLHRRHLTTSQRAAIAADLANLTNGQRADYAAASNEAAVSQAEAAEILTVSRSGVQRAVEVRAADPDLHNQVKTGEVSLEDARRAIAPDDAAGEGDASSVESTTQLMSSAELNTTISSWTAPESAGNREPDNDLTDTQSEAANTDLTDEEFIIEEFKRFVKQLAKDYDIDRTVAEIKSCIKKYLDRRK
jgi:ParB-like chromosome segregation protein Spo0J